MESQRVGHDRDTNANQALLNKLSFLFNFVLYVCAITPWLTCINTLKTVIRNFQSNWLLWSNFSVRQETFQQDSSSSQGGILCYRPLC